MFNFIKHSFAALSMAVLALMLGVPNAARAQVTVTTIAGGPGAGYLDGPGLTARLNQPQGIVLIGNYLYFVDVGNHVVRRIDTGTNIVTTIAGDPNQAIIKDGPISVARFLNIRELGKDGQGNLYVTSSDQHTIRKITNPGPGGFVSTIAGASMGFADGKATGAGVLAKFRYPVGVAGDLAGNAVYVADQLNHAIRKISLSSGNVATIAGHIPGGNVSGFKDSTTSTHNSGGEARFKNPLGIVVDPNGTGNIFVTDGHNHAIRLLKPNQNNYAYTVSTIAGGGGTAPGVPGFNPPNMGPVSAPNARFFEPWDIDVDAAGNLYVADRRNNAIRMLTKNTAGSYDVTTLAGLGPNQAGYSDGDETTALFNSPYDLAVDPSGCIIYVSDSFNNVIRKIERCEVDLKIKKTIKSQGGGQTVFQLTVSGTANGMQPGDTIRVGDGIPLGLPIQNYNAPGWTCILPGGKAIICSYILGAFPPGPVEFTVKHDKQIKNCAQVQAASAGVVVIEKNTKNNRSCVKTAKKLGSLEITKTVVGSSSANSAGSGAVYNVDVNCSAPSNAQLTVPLTIAGTVVPSIPAGSTCTITEQMPTIPLQKDCKWLTPKYDPGNSGVITTGGFTLLQIENSIFCKSGGPLPTGTLEIKKKVVPGNIMTASKYQGLIAYLNSTQSSAVYDVDVQCGTAQLVAQFATGSSATISSYAGGTVCALQENPPAVKLPPNCIWGTPAYIPGNSVTIPVLSTVSVTIVNPVICQ